MKYIFSILSLVLATSLASPLTTQVSGPADCAAAEKVKSGDMLSMHYTGTIDESSATGVKGSKFDSSRDRGQTFDFEIGRGQVIQGWEQGLLGLCKGARVSLVIPPELGYGERGAGQDIPGGATLNFDVEVMDIKQAPPQRDLFSEMDIDQSRDLTLEEITTWWTSNQDSALPSELWENEDKNKDGVVDWSEFSGPKGDAAPEAEL